MLARLSIDPRIVIPVVMLGGLAISLALYDGKRHSAVREGGRDDSVPPGDGNLEGTSEGVLPTAFDPSVSLAGRMSSGTPRGDPLSILLSFPSAPQATSGLAVQVAGPMPPGGLAPTAEPVETDCPEGMVLVEGDYCPVVGHVCLKPIEGPIERCEKYAAPPITQGNCRRSAFASTASSTRTSRA